MTEILRYDPADETLLLYRNGIVSEVLKYDGDPAEELPLNVPVEVETDKGELIHVLALPSGKARALAGDGRTVVDIAIAAISQHGSSPSGALVRQVSQDGPRLQADISMLLGDGYDVRVTEYVFECPRPAGLSLRYFDWSMFWDHVAEVNPGAEHTHWIGVGGPKADGNTCGRAWLGGEQAWVHEFCGYGTVIHEFGHSLGFDHSGTLAAEYGDRLSWMGNGERREAFTSPHFSVLDLYGARTEHVSYETPQRSVMLVEAESHATITPEGQAHFITADTDEGLVGIGSINGMVRIYKQARPGSWRKPVLIRENVSDEALMGLRVRVGERVRSAVQIHLARPGHSAFLPAPSGWVPEPDAGAPYIDPEALDGVWASRATYQGVFIWDLPAGREDNADILIGWLTWDRRGRPRYVYAICHLDGTRRSFAGPLQSTRRVGRFGSELYREGLVCFHRDEDRLVMRYDTQTLGRGEMHLNRVSRGDGGGRWGWYALEGVQHAGLLVSTNRPGPNQTVGTAAMYLIDHDDGSFILGNGQRWRYIDGPNTAFGEEAGFKLRSFRHPQRLSAVGRLGVEDAGIVGVNSGVTELLLVADGKEIRYRLNPVFNPE